MADIQAAPSGKGRRNLQPRVDLTPMVDLGFLLITFFMLSTTLAEKKSIVIQMPIDGNGSPSAIPDTATLTLLPAADHVIYYYEGFFRNSLKKTTITGLRGLMLRKQKELSSLSDKFSPEAHKLHVIIKPHAGSRYQDLVSTLDEMLICGVGYYVIMDPVEAENQTLESYPN
ncbi:MAG: biopolymer transporter ExbD [Sphingobacteriales bacterium]|nr:MAG: biopolymer transporter ExbD [Sphingobacteriales bacterium]